jgi:hypothetical protein
MFSGRKLVIATKHKKEEAIAPLLEKSIGVSCIVPEELDTDLLGTFSGEVNRLYNPIDTARKKCLMAIEQTNCDLAVASEGSFGPSPEAFFIPANEELLLFMDTKNDLEIVVKNVSYDTNFTAAEILSIEHLKEFVQGIGFPSHGLILRKDKTSCDDIIKGITQWEFLFKTFEDLMKKHGMAYAEADMRAMYNPTRMKVIERAAQLLVEKINSLCPQCNTPGFDIQQVQKGLPCQLCSMPTKSTLKHIYKCKKCSFIREVIFPNKVFAEDPMYCDFCNP